MLLSIWKVQVEAVLLVNYDYIVDRLIHPEGSGTRYIVVERLLVLPFSLKKALGICVVALQVG